jgi:hypothetical protein
LVLLEITFCKSFPYSPEWGRGEGKARKKMVIEKNPGAFPLSPMLHP